MSAGPRIVVHPGKQSLADAAAARLVTEILDAQNRSPEAQLALTGGSMGSAIIASVAQLPARSAVDWSRVRVWWGDERYLPAGDPDRNDSQNDDAGLSALGLDPAKVHRVAGPEASEDAEASAEAYARTVREHGKGAFDVAILGVGPDGHIASLFPHHPACETTGTIAVAVHDSPKPPSDRVSLTFECLERSHQVWFLVSGSDKADAVGAALTPGTQRWDIPACGLRGETETIWLLDTDAAARVPSRIAE